MSTILASQKPVHFLQRSQFLGCIFILVGSGLAGFPVLQAVVQLMSLVFSVSSFRGSPSVRFILLFRCTVILLPSLPLVSSSLLVLQSPKSDLWTLPHPPCSDNSAQGFTTALPGCPPRPSSVFFPSTVLVQSGQNHSNASMVMATPKLCCQPSAPRMNHTLSTNCTLLVSTSLSDHLLSARQLQALGPHAASRLIQRALTSWAPARAAPAAPSMLEGWTHGACLPHMRHVTQLLS